MPFRTSRGSRHGRPPFSPVRMTSGSGMNGRMTAHCSSVSSILSFRSQTRSAVDLPTDGRPNVIEARLLSSDRLWDAF